MESLTEDDELELREVWHCERRSMEMELCPRHAMAERMAEALKQARVTLKDLEGENVDYRVAMALSRVYVNAGELLKEWEKP